VTETVHLDWIFAVARMSSCWCWDRIASVLQQICTVYMSVFEPFN